MGRSDGKEIVSRLRILLQHLLKSRHQPEHWKGGWEATILVQRKEIVRLLADHPSLAEVLRATLPDCHRLAVKKAADETGLPLSAFTDLCPFTLDEILDDRFLG